MIGKTISHYRITDRLGEGGMGVVYKAIDTRLERIVALKFLPPELTADPEARERFVQEAKTASSLDHPNICTIYEIDEVPPEGEHHLGQTFIAMAFYEGSTLKSRIYQDIISIQDIIHYTTQIAWGLARAHEAGIVHRDIKPANILITLHNELKIVDFGLAKVKDVSLTHSGSTLGTVAYMSPEQTMGEKVDSRTDLWSFGVVVYEMLTGRRPFDGSYESAVIYSILSDTPEPVDELRPDTPDGLVSMISGLLVKDPEARYADAHTALSDLERYSSSLPGPDSSEGGSPPSVAVLPFVNMSTDPEQEYFCDGMAEEIINALTQVPDLHVIARTSAFSFKDKQIDIRQIGNKLGVGAVLEGSVRKAGNRLRITAQLINTVDGAHLWSERFDRDLLDVFDIQDEIATSVVDKLKVALLGGTEEQADEQLVREGTGNMEAYSLFLKAMALMRGSMMPTAIFSAIEHLERAIDLDPGFARAHALLAWAASVLSPASLAAMSTMEAYSTAKDSAEAAVRLDSNMGFGQAVLGMVRAQFEWDWTNAEICFRNAKQLSPGDADVHALHSWCLRSCGHLQEALEAGNHAQQLDPLDPTRADAIATAYFFMGRFKDASRLVDEIVDKDPDNLVGRLHQARIALLTGNYGRAIEFTEKILARLGREPLALGLLSECLVMQGETDAAESVVGELRELAGKRFVSPTLFAGYKLSLGDLEGTIQCLEEACRSLDPLLPSVLLMPRPSVENVRQDLVDQLERDPRFVAIKHKVGIVV